MISVEVLLKQMAWANQEIYKEVGKLDMKFLIILFMTLSGL